MTEVNEVTDVVLRRWYRKCDGTGLIALFPGEVVTDSGLVQSFEHFGQHGPADYDGVIRRTKPVRLPRDWELAAPLIRELESAPYCYRLRVIRNRNGRKAR